MPRAPTPDGLQLFALANLAELGAAALRQLAGSLELAPLHPGRGTDRTLAEDRRQAQGALTRFADACEAAKRIVAARRARIDATAVTTERNAGLLRNWAAAWDDWALTMEDRPETVKSFRFRAHIVGDQEAWNMMGLGDEAIVELGEARDEGEAPLTGPDTGPIWSELFEVEARTREAAREQLIAAFGGHPWVSLAGADPRGAIKDVSKRSMDAERRLDLIVDFWLNVYDELDEQSDPEEALAEMLDDPAAARRVWRRFTALTPEEEKRFLLALRTDEDAVRAWNEVWLRGSAHVPWRDRS